MMRRFRIILIFLIVFSSAAALAQRMTVTAPVANIRSGPGTQHDVLWEVEKYHPVFVMESSGSWYHFRDFEGDRGWVHKSLVGKTPAVITKKDQCNVRSGPNLRESILFTVEKGIPFKVVKRKGHWLQVEHADGDRGWIYDSLVW